MPGLFDPLTIGTMQLKNRIVMPPMGTRLAEADGAINDEHISHYTARARAGVGLVIVEHSYTDKRGCARLDQVGAYDDVLIPGLRRLADEVHRAGAAICLQINHAGALAPREATGEQPAGPSDVPPPQATEAPRALTQDEIRGIVESFARAAERAVAASFDAVEVHGSHGYLLSQFASPITNKRTDEYGGDLQGRFRFPLEVLRAVRSRLPADYPLFYRLGADDLLPDGLMPDEARAIAPSILQAGVDVIDVSGGLGGSGRERFTEQGFFVPLAHSIKEASGAIVIGVGNIRDPQYADEVVREGLIDLVAVGREQLRHAEWAAKAAMVLGKA
ncbi:MAG: NADH:flavin oxidoreductase [Chloroflexota bacterium]